MCFAKYFARLEKVDHEWKEYLEKAKIPLTVLANQSKHFRAMLE
jgi:hypothetical protein